MPFETDSPNEIRDELARQRELTTSLYDRRIRAMSDKEFLTLLEERLKHNWTNGSDVRCLMEKLAVRDQRITDLEFQLAGAQVGMDLLRAAVDELRKSVLNQAGDNLCWLKGDEAPEAPSQIPPRAEFLESCARYHAQIAGERGELQGCRTIAQLETDNQTLRNVVVELHNNLSELGSIRRDFLEFVKKVSRATVTVPWEAGYAGYMPTAGDPEKSITDLIAAVSQHTSQTCAEIADDLQRDTLLITKHPALGTCHHTDCIQRRSITQAAGSIARKIRERFAVPK